MKFKATLFLLGALLCFGSTSTTVKKHFYYSGKNLFVFREDGVWLNYHSGYNYGKWPPNNRGVWEEDNGKIKIWSNPKSHSEEYLAEKTALQAEHEKAFAGYAEKWKAGMTVAEWDAMMLLQKRYTERFCALISKYQGEFKRGLEPEVIAVKNGSFTLVENTYTYIKEEDFLNLKLRHPDVK